MEENKVNIDNNIEDTKIKSKMRKLICLAILVLIALVCYFIGYFVGTNLNKNDKENDKKVVEKDEQGESLEDEFIEEEFDVEETEEEEFDEDEMPKWALNIGVNFVSSKNKEEQEAIKIAMELYHYGYSALMCDEFEYGKYTSNGFLVSNFKEVNSMFTKNNLVDSLPGGDNFVSFAETMGMVEKNGKNYVAHQCDRGSHRYYMGTIVELVSFDDNEIKMEAISIYYDDELENDNFVTVETYDFIVQYEDNKWKIAKMTLPA